LLDDELRRDGIEMIAPHRANRSKQPTQDRRRLNRYMRSLAPNPNENEEMCLKYSRLTVQAAKALLPYQNPRIRAISYAPAPEQHNERKKTRLTSKIFDKP
jgi:hypothetical protein